MKKFFASLVLLSILFSFSVSANHAICMPFPVWGKIDYFGEKLSNQKVHVDVYDFRGNLEAGFDTFTNGVGEYSDDLANRLPDCWFRSASLVIDACDGSPNCVKKVDIGKDSSIRVDFVFKEVGSVPVVPEVIYQEKPVYVCWNGEQRLDAQLCPIQPPIVVPGPAPVPPPSPVPIIEPPVDDNDLQAYLIGLIAGILILFGWGKGFAALIKFKLDKAKEAEKKGDKELAAKLRSQAEKMAKTVVFNFLAGKYKK